MDVQSIVTSHFNDFFPELAQARLDWRHAYIMKTTLALFHVHLIFTLVHPMFTLRTLPPPCAYCDVTCRHPLNSTVGVLLLISLYY